MSSPYPNSPRGKAQGEGCDSDREGVGEPHTNPPWTCEHMLSAQGLLDPMTSAPQHVFYESRPPHTVESRNLARGLAAVQRHFWLKLFSGEKRQPPAVRAGHQTAGFLSPSGRLASLHPTCLSKHCPSSKGQPLSTTTSSLGLQTPALSQL